MKLIFDYFQILSMLFFWFVDRQMRAHNNHFTLIVSRNFFLLYPTYQFALLPHSLSNILLHFIQRYSMLFCDISFGNHDSIDVI